MRVLRLSMWAAPDAPPMSTVMRDCDLRMSIEDTIKAMTEEPPASVIERPVDNPVFESVFFVYETFDMQNTEIEAATVEAKRRLAKREVEERNMAVLYFYNIQALKIVQAGGVLINPKPAPLNANDIEMALSQVASHPNYRGQKVVTNSYEGVVVELTSDGIRKIPASQLATVTKPQQEGR